MRERGQPRPDVRHPGEIVLRGGDGVGAREQQRGHLRVAKLDIRARELYEETADSIAARERTAERLRSAPPPVFYEGGRPTKRDRRAIERLKDENR